MGILQFTIQNYLKKKENLRVDTVVPASASGMNVNNTGGGPVSFSLIQSCLLPFTQRNCSEFVINHSDSFYQFLLYIHVCNLN